jgi:iron complex outermembrane receptor protein
MGMNMRATYGTKAIHGLLAGVAMAAVSPAMAQVDTDTGPDARSAGDIIVTAQRREERLQDVPIALSAITARDIANRNVTSLNDLQSAVPGLRLVDIGPGSQRIQLRGISQYQGLPTVGNYIDEFSINPFGASGTAEVRLLDMERVEVLRGPQAVLYGEGSMGGTIRYVTAKPQLDEVSGSVLGELNSVRGGEIGYRAEGVLNLPIATDMVGLRVAAAHEEQGGWTDGPLGKDVNDLEISTVRAKLLAQPSDALSIALMGMYHEADQGVKSYSNRDRTTDQIVASPARQQYWLGTLEIGYDFGPATLTSITGYLEQKSRSVDDSGPFYNTAFIPLIPLFPLFGLPAVPENSQLFVSAVSDLEGKLTKWSQEFRITSNGEGPLRYVFGASYTNGKTRGDGVGNVESAVPDLIPSDVLGATLGAAFIQRTREQSKIYAFYGSVGYDLTDALTLDVGGRYFIDKRSVDSFLSIAPPVGPQSDTFKSFNPRVSLTARTGDSGIVFATVSKGFRSGGFNISSNPNIPAAFDPEKLWSYEAGLKQSLLDGRLFIEASFYYNDYKNIQSNTLLLPGIAALINSGTGRGPGVDLSVQMKPSREITFTGTVGYNHMRFKTASVDKIQGDPFDLVPDWNWSAAIDYRPQLSDTVGFIAHADIGFIDSAQIALRQIGQVVPTEAREVANVRLGVTFDRFEAYAFANNVFDTSKIVNPAFGAFFEPIYTRPRTIGVGVKGAF